MTVLPFKTAEDVAAAAPTAASHLERGGLLAYPTETIYGLGSRARTEDLTSLATLKGRGPEKPFLLLVSNSQMAESCGLVMTPAARALATRFWPGPLTLVLAGGEGRLPDVLRGPEGGIAVRWTSHSGVAGLIRTLNEPISSTSANRFGEPTAPGVGAIVDAFSTAIDSGQLLVLDGGVLGNVPPSTVIDCTRNEPRLIREGAITKAELRIGPGTPIR
jgi:L-threonylcarbamoyladenylate synthase